MMQQGFFLYHMPKWESNSHLFSCTSLSDLSSGHFTNWAIADVACWIEMKIQKLSLEIAQRKKYPARKDLAVEKYSMCLLASMTFFKVALKTKRERQSYFLYLKCCQSSLNTTTIASFDYINRFYVGDITMNLFKVFAVAVIQTTKLWCFEDMSCQQHNFRCPF